MGVSISAKIVEGIRLRTEVIYEQEKRFHEKTGEPYYARGKFKEMKFYMNTKPFKTDMLDEGDCHYGTQLCLIADGEEEYMIGLERYDSGDLMYSSELESREAWNSESDSWNKDLLKMAEEYDIGPSIFLITSVR